LVISNCIFTLKKYNLSGAEIAVNREQEEKKHTRYRMEKQIIRAFKAFQPNQDFVQKEDTVLGAKGKGRGKETRATISREFYS
jgi:hypothetical protein